MSWEDDFDKRLPVSKKELKEITASYQPCPSSSEKYSFGFTDFRQLYAHNSPPIYKISFAKRMRIWQRKTFEWCKDVIEIAFIIGLIVLMLVCLALGGGGGGGGKHMTFLPIFSGKSFTMIPIFY